MREGICCMMKYHYKVSFVCFTLTSLVTVDKKFSAWRNLSCILGLRQIERAAKDTKNVLAAHIVGKHGWWYTKAVHEYKDMCGSQAVALRPDNQTGTYCL